MNRPVRERFDEKVERTDSCWNWAAGLQASGYGAFFYQGGAVSAHRVAYELYVGPIPDGLQLDHLCRNRRCVNPAHLEVVDNDENARRAAESRTTCRRGHEYSPENVGYAWRVLRTGRRLQYRFCKSCARLSRQRSRIGDHRPTAAPWPTPDDITEDVA